MQKENIVHTRVMFRSVFTKEQKQMDRTYYESVILYLSTMHQAKALLNNGILSRKEYDNFDTIIADKYGISSYSIYRQNA